jgi:2-beta-glucuronyltransferase
VNASPYEGGINAVWVGRILLDAAFLDAASARLPDWTFHVIGPTGPSAPPTNVVWHGELRYEQTIPFIQHADVGLATFGDDKGHVPRYLADSSGKFVQYAYCGLPIVAPAALRTERPHTFYYEFGGGDSIEAALRAALAAGKRPELAETIPSWHELATALAGQPPD